MVFKYGSADSVDESAVTDDGVRPHHLFQMGFHPKTSFAAFSGGHSTFKGSMHCRSTKVTLPYPYSRQLQ
jgi:hypothetical protein